MAEHYRSVGGKVEARHVRIRPPADIAILLILLAVLASGERVINSADAPTPFAGATPQTAPCSAVLHARVEVDGVAIGATQEYVMTHWRLSNKRWVGGEWLLEEREQSNPKRIPILDRRYARVEKAGSVSEVHGRRLTIKGGPTVGVGDTPDRILELFGDPDRSIALTRGGCGNPGPMTRWSYRRHGVIISYLVPNDDFWRSALEESQPDFAKGLTFEEVKMSEPLMSEVQEVAIYRRAIR